MSAAPKIGRRACARAGLTLVELLVAIAIVAILSTLLLGVAGRAGETAREARTKQLIARLHTLVLERYESYAGRRVETRDFTDSTTYRNYLTTNTGMLIPGSFRPVGQEPRIATMTRVAGLRELAKLEMPDRWSDVVGAKLPTGTGSDDQDAPEIDLTLPADVNLVTPRFLRENPSVHSIYLREYNKLANDGFLNTVTGAPNTVGQIRENQNAELLYLVVMNTTADGEARGLFQEADTGDIDGDGAREFIDGWGNPIRWLRWAPGFESDLQLSFTGLQRVNDRNTDGSQGPYGLEGVVSEISDDFDPFDLFHVDQVETTDIDQDDMSGARGWRLVPLIYSAGGDEETGLYFGDEYVVVTNPYANDTDADETGFQRLGAPFDPETPVDNIHNHYISTR